MIKVKNWEEDGLGSMAGGKALGQVTRQTELSIPGGQFLQLETSANRISPSVALSLKGNRGQLKEHGLQRTEFKSQVTISWVT